MRIDYLTDTRPLRQCQRESLLNLLCQAWAI
jgi:hypothetical protein